MVYVIKILFLKKASKNKQKGLEERKAMLPGNAGSWIGFHLSYIQFNRFSPERPAWYGIPPWAWLKGMKNRLRGYTLSEFLQF